MTDQNIPSHMQTQIDAQAPARRFGSCVALVVGLLVFVCGIGLWFLMAGESLHRLGDSISLATRGVKTSGMITNVEEFLGDRNSTTSYRITVSFDVDGVTYSVAGLAYYKTDGTSLVGDSMPVIYDPDDPNIAMIDTFQERWFEPIVGSMP